MSKYGVFDGPNTRNDKLEKTPYSDIFRVVKQKRLIKTYDTERLPNFYYVNQRIGG